MTDTLRTRIAAVMYERTMSRLAWHRDWADLQPEVQQMWLDDADAMIRELGLRKQTRPDWIDRDDVLHEQRQSRYVTEWSIE